MNQKASLDFESIMELIKNVLVIPRSPSSPLNPKLYQSIDYSLLLQFGPLSKTKTRKKFLLKERDDLCCAEETDSGISSLSSPTPDLERKRQIEEFDQLEDIAFLEFTDTTSIPFIESASANSDRPKLHLIHSPLVELSRLEESLSVERISHAVDLTSIPFIESASANSDRPKSLLIHPPLVELSHLEESLSVERINRAIGSTSLPSIMDLHDQEFKRDNFFQANFERRYFPVLRDILGGQSVMEDPPQSTKSSSSSDFQRQQLPSSPRLSSLIQSPSSDYESSDFEDKSVPEDKSVLGQSPSKSVEDDASRLPSESLISTSDDEEEEEADEGVECMTAYSDFIRDFLRQPVTADAQDKDEEIVSILKPSLLEDVVVRSTMTPPSSTLLVSSTPVISDPTENAEPILSSCFLFEINMDALPRCAVGSPTDNLEEASGRDGRRTSRTDSEDSSRKDDSNFQKRCSADSISSNPVCEGPVEILIPAKTASFSIEIENAAGAVPAAFTSQSSEGIKSDSAVAAAASPRVLIAATSCDLKSATAELEITFLSNSIDDDDDNDDDDDDDGDASEVEDSDFDDDEVEEEEEEDEEEDGIDDDEDLLVCLIAKGDSAAEAEEEDEKTCLFSVLDILNGSGSGRRRRISEQSFESVDWSESDNDDSQNSYADDGSNQDQDLVSLWESFQPQVVAVSRKSPSEGPTKLEHLVGEGSDVVKEGEEREEEEELREEEVFEEAEDHFDQKEDSNSPQEEEEREEEGEEEREEEEEKKKAGKSPGKKTVSFAPSEQLVQVHHLDDDEETSRRGQWEEIARDRERFRKRILNAQMALGGIFSNFHRGVMFQSIHASGTCPCHQDEGDSESSDYEDCSDGKTL